MYHRDRDRHREPLPLSELRAAVLVPSRSPSITETHQTVGAAAMPQELAGTACAQGVLSPFGMTENLLQVLKTAFPSYLLILECRIRSRRIKPT